MRITGLDKELLRNSLGVRRPKSLRISVPASHIFSKNASLKHFLNEIILRFKSFNYILINEKDHLTMVFPFMRITGLEPAPSCPD